MPAICLLTSIISIFCISILAGIILFSVAAVSTAFKVHKFLISELGVTSKRIIGKVEMFINNNYINMSLNKIEDIDIRQSIINKIFGCATIILADVEGNKKIFRGIANPYLFNRILQEQILAADYLRIYEENESH